MIWQKTKTNILNSILKEQSLYLRSPAPCNLYFSQMPFLWRRKNIWKECMVRWDCTVSLAGPWVGRVLASAARSDQMCSMSRVDCKSISKCFFEIVSRQWKMKLPSNIHVVETRTHFKSVRYFILWVRRKRRRIRFLSEIFILSQDYHKKCIVKWG